jgi:serine/threonine protein kinase
MGEDSRGGGQKVMCEDPATGKVFHVVATPILRKEDEAFMLAQLNALFTTACPNLTRVVDFSVHQLRDFNDKGFSSIDERMAIAVLDYIEGCTVMQFLQKNWDSVTNDAFRDLLCQIMGALKALHRAGITHRNIHPDAIVLQLPSTRVAIKKRTAATRSSSTDRTAQKGGRGVSASAKLLSQMMVCYLGDYWFLHNPRSVGCESSVGRADWGAPMTVPPEAVLKQYPQPGMLRSASSGSARDTTLSRIATVVARRNASTTDTDALPRAPVGGSGDAAYTDKVTDKSDMYAFGVCLYYWATNGLHGAVPLNSEGFVDLNAVKRNLPLKWKPWLHSLFDMCLQVLPENRAAAKDVHLFLSSRFGK